MSPPEIELTRVELLGEIQQAIDQQSKNSTNFYKAAKESLNREFQELGLGKESLLNKLGLNKPPGFEEVLRTEVIKGQSVLKFEHTPHRFSPARLVPMSWASRFPARKSMLLFVESLHLARQTLVEIIRRKAVLQALRAEVTQSDAQCFILSPQTALLILGSKRAFLGLPKVETKKSPSLSEKAQSLDLSTFGLSTDPDLTHHLQSYLESEVLDLSV